MIAEQDGKLGETLKTDEAEMRNLHQHAAPFMGLGRNLDGVSVILFFSGLKVYCQVLLNSGSQLNLSTHFPA